MKWHKSESTIRPDEVDTTSSKTTVYLRRNIVEKQREDLVSDNAVTYFEYDEVKMSKDEYAEYLKSISLIDTQQQRADIDYIALCLGVDLYEV